MLFARTDAVIAAWRVVEPVLEAHPRTVAYEPGTWGPSRAETFIPEQSWHDPD
jgi:glucose-6-phosphate 1-dehydrogenase